MPIRFFNTYSRELESFEPLDPPNVKMYTCGPTVYNHAHIGNFRAYMFEDLLQRFLELRGYKVERVMNLTDVDDKTIRNSRASGQLLDAFTQRYKEAFFEDLRTLRIKPASAFPAATEPRYIERMIEMIHTLLERGHAYQAEDRSIYFRLSTFPEYGKLAHFNLEELRPSGRVRSDEYEKESIGDFALWKAWDEADGDVVWESPWGKGRPGWHIECSAMATALLGPQLDIHCGAVDNIFPHHEAEIAQSECCTGKRFVRYWLHCAHLIVNGQKMSKSLGNFFTLRDVLGKGWTGREIRYALISVNYRLPLNFTFDGLAAARAALQRIDEWTDRLNLHAGLEIPLERFFKQNLSELSPIEAAEHLVAQHKGVSGEELRQDTGWIEEYGERFSAALDDDLNVSAALSQLFDLIRESNRRLDASSLTRGQATVILAVRWHIDSVLALYPESDAVPLAVLQLLEERKAARGAKDWKKSDELRDKIVALGWQVKDTKDGQKITRA